MSARNMKGETLMNEIRPMAFNLSEAAKAIHVSRPTMQNLVNRSDFPSFRVGGRWIIPVEPFAQWLKEQAKNYVGKEGA